MTGWTTGIRVTANRPAKNRSFTSHADVDGNGKGNVFSIDATDEKFHAVGSANRQVCTVCEHKETAAENV